MPTVSAWIDELREAFGREVIHEAIRAGMNGQPTFYARENGIEVGTAFPPCKEFPALMQGSIEKPKGGRA